jgi:hypothetical protein
MCAQSARNRSYLGDHCLFERSELSDRSELAATPTGPGVTRVGLGIADAGQLGNDGLAAGLGKLHDRRPTNHDGSSSLMRAWTLIWTLMGRVSCVSCVSSWHWVNAAETYETVSPGVRYAVPISPFAARSEFGSGLFVGRRGPFGPFSRPFSLPDVAAARGDKETRRIELLAMEAMMRSEAHRPFARGRPAGGGPRRAGCQLSADPGRRGPRGARPRPTIRDRAPALKSAVQAASAKSSSTPGQPDRYVAAASLAVAP